MTEEIEFSHLHVHSEYSTLDGKSSVIELIDKAKSLGQSSLAITDHGSTSALWSAQKYAEEVGIKLILGTEFYYERENDGKNGHLLVLAKDNKGLENIFKLQKYGFTENFYRKPRIDWKTLLKHKEGLVITSACLASTICQYIMEGEMNLAMEWARKFQEEFKEDFYLEIQSNGVPIQYEVNRSLLSIGNKLGIKVIATNDVHYANKEDWLAHEVMLAMQTKRKMNDEKRFKFEAKDFHLKDSEEMIKTMQGIDRESAIKALNATQEIVDKCDAKLIPGKYLPEYYNLEEKTARGLLIDELMKGAKRIGKIQDKEYMKEVQHELDVVDNEGYSNYFLIVQDYIRSARERGEVVGDGRGSASGAKMSYLTDITRIDPNEHNLLFERFMSPGRSPDVDTDFSNQENVFIDLQKKYGKDSVAKIVTFGTMKPRGVVRKVLSTFDFEQSYINQISKLIPHDTTSIKDAYKNSAMLRQVKEEHFEEFKIIESLEGKISHEGQHAGGIVIYPDIYKYLPVKTIGEDREKLIVAFDMNEIEELGFYKFDVLGLTTVDVIHDTQNYIKETTGEEINLYEIDYEDENVYKMLSKGDLSGVFQLSNQVDKVTEQKPSSFNDLIAINALIRPGVGDFNEYISRRNGKEWKTHPDRMYYMEETEGLLVYQEQFLLDAKTFAGWDIAYADKHIRKNRDIKNDVELKDKFIFESELRGYNPSEMEEIWEDIQNSAGQYSFNKAHSASYSMTSYQTAYLKYYYPKEFYSALMGNEDDGTEGQIAISQYINEMKNRGVPLLPPDINISKDRFIPTKEGVRFKINVIRHLGDSALTALNKMLPIKNFDDFLERRNKTHMRKNTVENLIKAGCFDFDEPNRAELLWRFEMELRTKTQIKDNFQCEKKEWNDGVKAEWEKESLGMYLSSHPMEKYGFKPLEEFRDGSSALQGGEVAEVTEVTDKKNNLMAFVNIDSLFGIVKVIVFSSFYKRKEIKDLLEVGKTVMIKGNRSGDSILLNEMEELI